MTRTPLTGIKAPVFELQNTNGELIKLQELTGRQNLLILFFPLAFTQTCTTELCSVRDNMKMYNALDCKVLAVSVDSRFALKEFRQSQNLNFDLLSDFNKEVSARYGVLNSDFYGMRGVAKRAAFVINKRGEVVYEEVLEDASLIPDFGRIIQVIGGLK